MTISNIAIIGGGPWGLCAAKNGLEQGANVTVYERNEALGGTWRYIDETGKDKYGLNIHTAMYKDLRTNITIGRMEFPDFPFPGRDKTVYEPYSEVLSYYEFYADHFDLKKHIKYSHNVIRVVPIENEKWEIIVKDLVNNIFETTVYDAVFVASGLFSVPHIPEIEGASEFKGKVIHSHDFRDAERYRGERVLIIGRGISGTDIAGKLENVAKTVILSGRKLSPEALRYRDPPLSVKRFFATGAEFVDGSYETFSVIIYATGYSSKFPFLSSECGIHVDDNYIQPLYKQMINIEHPTMVFFGAPPIHEMKVKFALKFVTGAMKRPSKHEMLEEMQEDYIICRNMGLSNRNIASYLPIRYSDEYAKVAEIPDEKIRF